MRFFVDVNFFFIFSISLFVQTSLESMRGQAIGWVQILYLHEIDILQTFHMR